MWRTGTRGISQTYLFVWTAVDIRLAHPQLVDTRERILTVSMSKRKANDNQQGAQEFPEDDTEKISFQNNHG